jgi:hypothetical protein
MFGEAGRTAATIVLHWAPILFDVPIDPLSVRVVLAPHEMGGYNRHAGYHSGDGAGSETFILANMHYCKFNAGGDIVINPQRFTDFIVHELCHSRQADLLRENIGRRGWAKERKVAHRDRGWYQAITEGSKNYLNLVVPETIWPKRGNEKTLTDSEATGWPESFRALVKDKDPRMPRPTRRREAV